MTKKINKIIAAALATIVVFGTPLVSIDAVAADISSAVTSAVTSAKLNITNTTLTKGYKFSLKLNNASGDVSYKSYDSSIATVSSNGSVVGKTPGVVKIAVTDANGTYYCTVKVVATKISVSPSKIEIDEDESISIPVTVKGSKHLRADSMDKSIATVSWSGLWENNSVNLKINAVSEGTTTVDIYNPNYPNIKKTISVTVGDALNVSTDTEDINIGAGTSYTFDVKAAAKEISVYSSDSNIAVASIRSKGTSASQITITGISSGVAGITVYNSNNKAQRYTIPVTVTGGPIIDSKTKYYQTYIYNLVSPQLMTLKFKSATDKMAYWVNKDTSQLEYMIVPYNYKPETSDIYVVSLNTLYTNNSPLMTDPEYYTYQRYYASIYDDYLYFTYRTYNLINPENNSIKMKKSDKFIWKITSNGIIQYMIVPSEVQLDYSNFENVLNADGSSFVISTDYYKISYSIPRKKISSDIILSWTTEAGSYAYMLVPSTYDQVRADTIKAKSTESYDYYTIYSSKPKKSRSSDIIINYWNDRTSSDRYILVPYNYNETKVEKLQGNDIDSAYVVDETSIENNILVNINNERSKSGITALSTYSTLDCAATIRLDELSTKFSHKRPDGTSYITALELEAVDYSRSEEIILKNIEYSSDAIEILFNDPDYRDILLSSLNKNISIQYDNVNHYLIILIVD